MNSELALLKPNLDEKTKIVEEMMHKFKFENEETEKKRR